MKDKVYWIQPYISKHEQATKRSGACTSVLGGGIYQLYLDQLYKWMETQTEKELASRTGEVDRYLS